MLCVRRRSEWCLPSRRQLSPFDHMVRNSANGKLVVPLESLDNSQSCRKRVLVVWFLLHRTGRNICIVRGETSASYGEKQPFRFLIGASTDIISISSACGE